MSPASTNFRTKPAYAAVFLILLTLGYLTHTRRLSPWVAGIGLEVGQIVFYILLITVNNATAKYVFVVIATAATQSFFPIIWPGEFCDTDLTSDLSPGPRPRCMNWLTPCPREQNASE